MLSSSCLALSQEEDLLQRHPRRIISFHAPSPIEADFSKQQVPIHQQLVSLQPVSSEPAPVHEEQNEPPPPPPRVRAGLDPLMSNPPGYAVDAANLFVAQGIVSQISQQQQQQQAAFNAGAVPGVVQVTRPIIPNGPSRIVNPPPPESIPTTNVQPISIDPATGEPLKNVSPTFRALLAPNAPAVNVPAPIQASFGRGFGGAPILDVTGSNPQQSELQNSASFPSGFEQSNSGFSNVQQSSADFSNFQQPNSQPSSFQSLGGNDGGDIISVQNFGATSSINSNSQSFGSTPISVGSAQSQNSSPLGDSLSSSSLGESSSVVTSTNGGSSHSVHISLPQSSYSSTVFHGNSN